MPRRLTPQEKIANLQGKIAAEEKSHDKKIANWKAEISEYERKIKEQEEKVSAALAATVLLYLCKKANCKFNELDLERWFSLLDNSGIDFSTIKTEPLDIKTLEEKTKKLIKAINS